MKPTEIARVGYLRRSLGSITIMENDLPARPGRPKKTG
jgi:hypothetical protein